MAAEAEEVACNYEILKDIPAALKKSCKKLLKCTFMMDAGYCTKGTKLTGGTGILTAVLAQSAVDALMVH